MEEASRQNDEGMENIGNGLIIGGSVGFSLWVIVMVLWYLK